MNIATRNWMITPDSRADDSRIASFDFQPVRPHLKRLYPGTWGFGLWNDPFGLSFGFGGKSVSSARVAECVWFFGASKENYLSFKDDKPANSFFSTIIPLADISSIVELQDFIHF